MGNKVFENKVFIVREGGKTRVFSAFEKAVAHTSSHNYKVHSCRLFNREDKGMYDQFMDECLGNMWLDRSAYEQWREDKLTEYGITEDDLSVYTEVLFIEEVGVE